MDDASATKYSADMGKLHYVKLNYNYFKKLQLQLQLQLHTFEM